MTYAEGKKTRDFYFFSLRATYSRNRFVAFVMLLNHLSPFFD